jgi:hypothetical protein
MHTTELMLSLRNLFSSTRNHTVVTTSVISRAALDRRAIQAIQLEYSALQWVHCKNVFFFEIPLHVWTRILIKFASREIKGNKSLFRGYIFFCKDFFPFFFCRLMFMDLPWPPPMAAFYSVVKIGDHKVLWIKPNDITT